MSFKIRPEWGPLPAEMVDGVIVVDGGAFPDVDSLKLVKGLNMDKQHLNFSNKYIQCVLINDKYTFVLRWDSSYTVYLNSNGAIFVNYRPDSITNPAYMYDIDMSTTIFGGIYSYSDVGIRQGCYLVETKDGLYLFIDGSRVVGRNVNKDTYYYHYCKINRNPVKPYIYMDKEQRLYTNEDLSDPILVSEYLNLDYPITVKPKGG